MIPVFSAELLLGERSVAEVVFWGSAGLVVFAYGGYSLVIFLLSVVRNRRVRRADIEPMVTMIITAYNEEKDIGRKLDQTLALDYPRERMEIIVASDGSTDRTDEIVGGYAAHGIRLVRVEGRLGKTGTQNEAVRHAKGEIVVFSDATTRYDPRAIRKLVRNYADPEVGAVSGRYEYVSATGASMGLGTILFWKYENLIKTLQTRISTITGCCGCIYSVRRSLFVPLPREIISDLCEPLAILSNGHRIVFEPEAVAYEETTEKAREEFSMRVRVISRGMHGLLYMRRLLNPFRFPFVTFQLLSHKILRWMVPVLLLLMFVANIFLLGEPVYNITFALAVLLLAVAGVVALVERHRSLPSVLGVPLYFLTVNAASLAAMYRVAKGVRATTWETVRR
jgi:cellulose synthase/poly-beta-1,6-N-acetylglucosamine synthase-like glycosyltransferase